MSGISEAQLQTWANQGSVVQSQQTFETIKRCLDDPNSDYASKSTDNFLQGSFANSTNIYADSDVDIAQVLTSTFYKDLSELDEQQRQRYNEHFGTATYTYKEFKQDVLRQLTKCFGSGVKAGNKAIFVPGNEYRRDADVLPAAEYRRYWNFYGANNQSYTDGIVFWTSEGEMIINYPKQHLRNCAQKNQNTGHHFKPNARVFKNYRNAMIRDGYIRDGLAPSYFLEGALYNVPNSEFSSSHQNTVINSLNWWNSCDRDALVCANEMYRLLHPTSLVTWRREQFDEFVEKAISYWNDQ